MATDAGELDPVLDAMRMQFEAQAAFHAQTQQDGGSAMASSPGMGEMDNLTHLFAQAQHGAVATGLAGLLQQHQAQPSRPATFEKGKPQPGGGGPVGRGTLSHSSSSRGPLASSSGVGPALAGSSGTPTGSSLLDQPNEVKDLLPRLSRTTKETKEEKAQKEAEAQQEAEKLRCHLHKRPKDSCKFCKKWQDFVNKGKEDKAAMRSKMVSDSVGLKRDSAGEDGHSRGLLELANPKTFGLPPLLQSHIIESQHFKSLMTTDAFEQVVEEIWQFSDTVEPYMQNSATIPSALFVCLYRFLTLGMDARQLRRLIDNPEYPLVRCVGFLFVRFGLEPNQLWPWLGEYVLDEEEFRPTKDAEWVTTIGEYVEGLLSQERYYSIVFPRVPMSMKRNLEAKLAQVPQFRKRTQANRRLLGIYRQRDVRIEACVDDNAWHTGYIIELDESVMTRPKVHVRLEGGREAVVHIGKVILSDPRFTSANMVNGPYRAMSSHRRSRSRSPQVDWSRHKGKSQSELIGEQRIRDRERAVCASGKEYARKPVGFKVACALPREMGAASHRLMEDETFVPMRRESRRRSPSPMQQDAKKVQHSAEHQAQMQQLFEKYGMAKGPDAASQPQNNLVEGEGPDVMRLG